MRTKLVNIEHFPFNTIYFFTRGGIMELISSSTPPLQDLNLGFISQAIGGRQMNLGLLLV